MDDESKISFFSDDSELNIEINFPKSGNHSV